MGALFFSYRVIIIIIFYVKRVDLVFETRRDSQNQQKEKVMHIRKMGVFFFPYFGGDRVLYKIVHTQPKVFHKSCANLPGDTHKLQGEMKGGKNKKL